MLPIRTSWTKDPLSCVLRTVGIGWPAERAAAVKPRAPVMAYTSIYLYIYLSTYLPS